MWRIFSANNYKVQYSKQKCNVQKYSDQKTPIDNPAYSPIVVCKTIYEPPPTTAPPNTAPLNIALYSYLLLFTLNMRHTISLHSFMQCESTL